MNEGKKIYEKGDLANYFYVIKEGSVAFCEEEPDISFMEIDSGSYFGEYDILADEKRKYAVFCRSDSIIYRVSKFIFLDLFVNGDRSLSRIFKEISLERQRKFQLAFEQVKELTIRLSQEIEEEARKNNKFWKLQRAVYSQKFRDLVEQMKKPVTRAEKKRMTNLRKKYSDLENSHRFGRKRRTVGRKTFLIHQE